IELENLMGMKIGDKGFTVTELWNGELPLAILLNGVEKTREGDNFYLIGDFTFENLSDNYLEIERPDAAEGSDESAIKNGELEKYRDAREGNERENRCCLDSDEGKTGDTKRKFQHQVKAEKFHKKGGWECEPGCE